MGPAPRSGAGDREEMTNLRHGYGTELKDEVLRDGVGRDNEGVQLPTMVVGMPFKAENPGGMTVLEE